MEARWPDSQPAFRKPAYTNGATRRRESYEDRGRADLHLGQGNAHRPDTLTQIAQFASLKSLAGGAGHTLVLLTVAIGYLKAAHDQIGKDPDRRVQEAIALVCSKFAELQTVRQVHLWMRRQRLPSPATLLWPLRAQGGWKLPTYNTLHHMLTNPIYAGAYVFGRTGSKIRIEAGRKRITRGFRKDRGAWDVLIHHHHDGYIG